MELIVNYQGKEVQVKLKDYLVRKDAILLDEAVMKVQNKEMGFSKLNEIGLKQCFVSVDGSNDWSKMFDIYQNLTKSEYTKLDNKVLEIYTGNFEKKND